MKIEKYKYNKHFNDYFDRRNGEGSNTTHSEDEDGIMLTFFGMKIIKTID